jgi:hypothetical protein
MSEVDRLSNSGTYPALPIADQRSRREKSAGQAPTDKKSDEPGTKTAADPDPNQPRPPKSLVDEYA